MIFKKGLVLGMFLMAVFLMAFRTPLYAQIDNGTYKLTIFDPRDFQHLIPESIEVKKRDLIDFSVPSNVIGCSVYGFVPESELDLEYRLQEPDGAIIFPTGDHYFEISKNGTYTVRGIDPTGLRCPIVKTFQATIKQPSNIALEVMPFCSEDAFTIIRLDSQGLLVKWFKVEAGEEIPLPWADDNEMLFVDKALFMYLGWNY